MTRPSTSRANTGGASASAGRSIFESIDRTRWRAVAIGVTRDGAWRLGTDASIFEHADDVPTLNITPFLPLAQQQIVDVLASCGRYYRVNGEEGFEAFARAELIAANERIRLQIQRNPF